MCCTKYSSVINSIYSGQQVFSYTEYHYVQCHYAGYRGALHTTNHASLLRYFVTLLFPGLDHSWIKIVQLNKRKWCHDTEHNGTQHNDTQYKNTLLSSNYNKLTILPSIELCLITPLMSLCWMSRCYNTQHNDTQHNINVTKHNLLPSVEFCFETPSVIMLNVIMLNVKVLQHLTLQHSAYWHSA